MAPGPPSWYPQLVYHSHLPTFHQRDSGARGVAWKDSLYQSRLRFFVGVLGWAFRRGCGAQVLTGLVPPTSFHAKQELRNAASVDFIATSGAMEILTTSPFGKRRPTKFRKDEKEPL